MQGQRRRSTQMAAQVPVKEQRTQLPRIKPTKGYTLAADREKKT